MTGSSGPSGPGPGPSPVLRRHVFYIGGFFPAEPAFYQNHLIREAARYSRVHGVAVTVESACENGGSPARYRLRAERAGLAVETLYEVLRWDDIVLQQFAKPWSWRIGQAAATLVDYLSNGAYLGVARLMRRFALIWLFPFVYYGLAAVLAALAGFLVQGATRGVLGDLAAFVTGLAASGLLLLGFGAFGRTCYAYLFLNDWIFSRAVARDRAPEMWARIEAFADRVAAVCAADPDDEVVLIGHSFGASVAPLVMARLGARARGAPSGHPLLLLTLGGSLPVIGLHPKARRFRDAMRTAAALPNMAWIDVSSSYDAINIKRFDPVAGLNLQHGDAGARSPLLIDTRFRAPGGATMLRKMSLMRLHMQFIKSTERPSGYDYIGLITGAEPVERALARAVPP